MVNTELEQRVIQEPKNQFKSCLDYALCDLIDSSFKNGLVTIGKNEGLKVNMENVPDSIRRGLFFWVRDADEILASYGFRNSLKVRVLFGGLEEVKEISSGEKSRVYFAKDEDVEKLKEEGHEVISTYSFVEALIKTKL